MTGPPIVGHSLGGGVAMQFAYQYPEMVERLALVSSGGLGPEVSPVLRAAALPGADLFIGATASVGTQVGSLVGRGLGLLGLRPDPDVAEVARSYASLSDSDRRAAFLATVRAVIGTGGQRIDAADRLYLAEAVPVLISGAPMTRSSPSATARTRTRRFPAAGSRSSRGSATSPSSRPPAASSSPSKSSWGRPSRRPSTPRSGGPGCASPESMAASGR